MPYNYICVISELIKARLRRCWSDP